MLAALLAALGATAQAVPMNGAFTVSNDQVGGRSIGTDFSISPGEHVTLSAGAGFVVAYAGDILTMPGLPKVPGAEGVDIDANGNVIGLF
jgi:formate--tetrahydrofolate ligase